MKKRPGEYGFSGGRGHDGQAAAVLVVDDEDAVLELAVTALRRGGYRVLQASSAEEAETTFSEERDAIEVLVTDLMLKGLSGHELSRRFKTAKPELLIVFTTGYDVEQLPDGVRPDDGAELLQKPYTLRSLTDTVGRLLDRG